MRDHVPMKASQLSLKEAVELADEIISNVRNAEKNGSGERLELVKMLRDLSREFYNNGKGNATEIMQRILESNFTADHIDRVINEQD